jgi:hypothetical protein
LQYAEAKEKIEKLLEEMKKTASETISGSSLPGLRATSACLLDEALSAEGSTSAKARIQTTQSLFRCLLLE